MIPAKKVVVYTLLLVITLSILTYMMGGEHMLMTGDLSEGHEIFSKDCKSCHVPFKNDFKTCYECHKDMKEVSLHKKDAILCTHCHNGHKSGLKQVHAETCLSGKCHEKMKKKSDHSADPKICFSCHPEHQFEKKVPDVKLSDLIFSHKVHADWSNYKAYSPCESCHQTSIDGIRKETPKALEQCKDCHSEWMEKHDVKKTITKGKCVKCHYSEKKEIKGLGKDSRLKHARFKHGDHFNLECTICHFPMETFNELEDIVIFTQKNKYSLCIQCHFNPFL